MAEIINRTTVAAAVTAIIAIILVLSYIVTYECTKYILNFIN